MLTRLGCLLGLALLLAVGNDVVAEQSGSPAIMIDHKSSWGGGLTVNATDGWEFNVVRPVTVTSLGVWDNNLDGLGTEIPVGIFDHKGKLLVSATVPAGKQAPEIEEFRYVAIKPFRLEPGRNYYLGAAYKPQSNEGMIGGSTGNTFYSDGAVRWIRRRRIIGQAGLTYGQPGDSPGIVPGAFGPNFLLRESTTPRRYYRVQSVDDERRNITLNLPEAADDSHKREFVVLVTLFARKDGELTQLLVDGEPVGVGAAGLEAMSKAVDRASDELEEMAGVRPNVRIAAPSWARFSDVIRAVDAGSGRRINPRVRNTPPQKLEFATLVDSRIRHVKVNPSNRFIDHGKFVEDTWTGLLWQKDGQESGKMNFYAAGDYAAGERLGGLSDWRVPTIEELSTIFPATDAPFTGTHYTPDKCCEPRQEFPSYWTSEPDKGHDYAFIYQWYANGGPNNCFASRNYGYVRCVHDPVPGLKERAEQAKLDEEQRRIEQEQRKLTEEQRKLEEAQQKLEQRRKKLEQEKKRSRNEDRSDPLESRRKRSSDRSPPRD